MSPPRPIPPPPSTHSAPRARADYEYNKLPDAAERETIAKAVGLPARQVQVWFQNRRQRSKAPTDVPAPGKVAWDRHKEAPLGPPPPLAIEPVAVEVLGVLPPLNRQADALTGSGDCGRGKRFYYIL